MPSAERLNESNNYRAYLLRLWRSDGGKPWQIVAKNVETGEEYPFASLDALFEFLTGQVGQ